MTSALIISVVDIAAFAELVQLRVASPWIFTDYGIVWMVIALASMFGGALLALAQKDIKRMLAFSTIDDMGYLLLGVVAGGAVGLSGAWLGALSHSLFKVILFGAVGVAEKGTGKPVTLSTHGLAARYPVAAAAFIAGALGIIECLRDLASSGGGGCTWRAHNMAESSWSSPWRSPRGSRCCTLCGQFMRYGSAPRISGSR